MALRLPHLRAFHFHIIPGGIATRIAMTIVIAMLLVQGLNGVLYMIEGHETPRFPNSPQFAEEVATLVQQVEALPSDQRKAYVAALANPLVKVDWYARRFLRIPIMQPNELSIALQRDRLRARLSRRVEIQEDLKPPSQPGTTLSTASGSAVSGNVTPASATIADNDVPTAAEGEPPYRMMRIAVRLADASWLTFTFSQPYRGFDFERLTLRLGLAGLVIVLLSTWAARRLVRPIDQFARAATRLGIDPAAPPLVESGPSEVRAATQAFNQMQQRLRRFVDDRTQMLAAISHDLRTPITRLRLRVDMIEDEEHQRKFLDDLDDMEAMIDTTLSFARDDAQDEQGARIDLAVLLETLCDDAADAGHQAVYEGPEHRPILCRPIALQRALTNLIDNAIKYGEAAQVTLREAPGSAVSGPGPGIDTNAHIVITITDFGPGIPESEQEKVFAPFYRLEPSRSRSTGGSGLGLAVARSMIRAHGGDITLANRPEGGLLVTVLLPV